MKVKARSLFEMQEALKAMKEEKIRDFKTNLSIIRNRKLIEKEIEIIEALREPSEKFNEFERKRNELAVKHARKDKSGNPLLRSIQGQTVYDIEDEESFKEELDVLLKEYDAELKARDEQAEQYVAALNSEVEVDLSEFPESEMKKMPTAVLDPLFDLITPKPMLYTERDFHEAVNREVSKQNKEASKKKK